MERQGLISPFQLTVLLFLSRLFTIMTYVPAMEGQEKNGLVLLLGLLVSPLAQMALLGLGLLFCRRGRENSPLSFSAAGTGPLRRIVAAGYWLLVGAVCLYSVVGFIRFLAEAFYDSRFLWVLAATFCGAVGFCANRGVEALARASTVLLALTAVGLILLGGGMAGTADPQNFLMPLWDKNLFLQGIWQGVAMNFELMAILLLQSATTQGGLRTGAVWTLLGLCSLLTVGMGLGVTFSLGYYGQGKEYPLFSAAQAARLLFMERLDSAFLGLWILLGLVKVTLFLWLMTQLWGKVLQRPVTGLMTAVHSGGLLAAALLVDAFHGGGWLTRSMTMGWVPVLGVFFLPLVGFSAARHEERKKKA